VALTEDAKRLRGRLVEGTAAGVEPGMVCRLTATARKADAIAIGPESEHRDGAEQRP